MSNSIAVIGEKDSVLGFKAVGFDVYTTANADETANTIRRLARENCAIIYITEEAMEPVISLVEEYQTRQLPAIIPIPGKGGSRGIGIASVKKSVERAVGADILFHD